MATSLSLYAVSFVQAGTVRVVILHAHDEEDALYCVSEGWGEDMRNARVKLLEVGVMLTVYEQATKEQHEQAASN